MASSAFSSAGITISKRRSRLKGVEALQCLKCILRHDLIFREPEPCSALEIGLEDEERLLVGGAEGADETAWDFNDEFDSDTNN